MSKNIGMVSQEISDSQELEANRRTAQSFLNEAVMNINKSREICSHDLIVVFRASMFSIESRITTCLICGETITEPYYGFKRFPKDSTYLDFTNNPLQYTSRGGERVIVTKLKTILQQVALLRPKMTVEEFQDRIPESWYTTAEQFTTLQPSDLLAPFINDLEKPKIKVKKVPGYFVGQKIA